MANRQSFSSGEYHNTNEMRKFLDKIQTVDPDDWNEQKGSTTGWGYIDADDEWALFFDTEVRRPKKEEVEEWL